MAVIDDLNALEAKVTAEDSVIDSAVLLLGQLAQMLKDALANAGDTAALTAKVQEIATLVDQKSASLAAAVAANTPAAPPPAA